MSTETNIMGRVAVTAKIENLADLVEAEAGTRAAEDVRAITVDDALVDTGATMLSLPERVVRQLGLKKYGTKRAKTAAGSREFGIYSTVQLTVQGRDCRVDVTAVPDDCPPLIGQVPLELMDWVVDLQGQRLIGNPEHGGEQMIEMY